MLSGETRSFGAQEQRAEGRADSMSFRQVLTSMVHQRPSIQFCPIPFAAPPSPSSEQTPNPGDQEEEDLTTTSQHTAPPVLTRISIISGYKHQ